MLKETLIKLYERDLEKLRTEIEGFADESDLWKTADGISNSAGNLALHLAGNLQHFIGSVLGNSGYVRDRDAEFSSSDVPRSDILNRIEETVTIVRSTLSGFTDEQFNENYPIDVFGEPMTTGYFLVHLTTHFNYHLGQLNYHRRLVAGK
jgi:uncharacterized damage-inducible protein DinB